MNEDEIRIPETVVNDSGLERLGIEEVGSHSRARV